MDSGALASSVTTILGPLLPYLLKAGENVTEETGQGNRRPELGMDQVTLDQIEAGKVKS